MVRGGVDVDVIDFRNLTGGRSESCFVIKEYEFPFLSGQLRFSV